jgi:hypothetical protein
MVFQPREEAPGTAPAKIKPPGAVVHLRDSAEKSIIEYLLLTAN